MGIPPYDRARDTLERRRFLAEMLSESSEGYITSGSASRKKVFVNKKILESPPEDYNIVVPPQQLFSTKRIILIGIVLVSFLLAGTLYDSDLEFEFPELVNPFQEITDIIIPPTPPEPVKIHKDIWEEFSYVALGAENICDSQKCQDNLNDIYEITDCEDMIKFYKDKPYSVIRPALAKQILDVCWDEYHDLSRSVISPSIELSSGDSLDVDYDVELTWRDKNSKVEWSDNGYTMRLTNYTTNEIGILHTCSEPTVFESCVKTDSTYRFEIEIDNMGMTWNSDGTVMFIAKDNDIREYHCDSYDVSTCVFNDSIWIMP